VFLLLILCSSVASSVVVSRRSYDITGNEMEERMKESFLKYYFLSFLQDFPLSSSYFHLSEEDLKYFRFLSNSSSFDMNSSLPSFLVNPLTSFLFSSSSSNPSQQQQQQQQSSIENSKTKKAGDEDGNITDKEKGNLSYFSEVNYFYLLNEIIRFLLLQLNNELFEKEIKSFNEWGSLLLYEDLLLLRKCYDRLILPYEQSSTLAAVNGQQEPREGISSTTSVVEFLTMSDRYHYHIRKTKKLFHKVMNVMRLLTLDSPNDFKRYQYKILPTPAIPEVPITLPSDGLKTKTEKQPSSFALSGYFDRENDDEFNEKEIRYLLGKRIEFSKDTIQKLKLV
jgi:hypothetical protein